MSTGNINDVEQLTNSNADRTERTNPRDADGADSFGSLVDPASWADLIKNGIAHKVNNSANVEIRIGGTSSGATITGEIWILRAPDTDGGRAMGRKVAEFTAVLGGPSLANKHGFSGAADAGASHYLADDITLDFTTGVVAIEPETPVDTEECSILLDPRGAEYCLVKFATVSAGKPRAGLTNVGG